MNIEYDFNKARDRTHDTVLVIIDENDGSIRTQYSFNKYSKN